MLSTPNIDNILLTTIEMLADGNVEEAYNRFKVNWCGPAFLSKFLYFIGVCAKKKPMPLILDSLVGLSLQDILGKDHREVVSVKGKIIQRSSKIYLKYINTLHEWAQTLGCHPDSIEYWLFERRLNMRVKSY
jgi:hypothetical protein